MVTLNAFLSHKIKMIRVLVLLLLLVDHVELTKGFTVSASHSKSCSSSAKTKSVGMQPDDSKISESSSLRFGPFVIPDVNVFYKTAFSAAFVHNLHPVVKGHVLCISQRVTPSLKDLTDDEYSDLWATVQEVKAALERHYGAASFNVATQWGNSLTVPHVHVHVLPRSNGDFKRSDDVYAELEKWTPGERQVQAGTTLKQAADEANLYRVYFS